MWECECLQVCVCVCKCVCVCVSVSAHVRPVHLFQCSCPTVRISFTPSSIALVNLLNWSHFCSLHKHTHTHTYFCQTPILHATPRAPADGVGAQPTHTSMGSRSGASGSMVAKIITPTVSSFSAFLFPVFQSYNTINTVSTSGGVVTRHGRTDTRPKDPTRKRHRQARPSAARW